MDVEFITKLPTPKEIRKKYPLTEKGKQIKANRDRTLKAILSGRDKRLILIIGPCSADNEAAVLEYISRLKSLKEDVEDKIFIIPRVYTTKPRTTGLGYKGMLHSPVPSEKPDLVKGLVATRKLHIHSITELGLSCADEMLYPEEAAYLTDVLSYLTIGARSVENQAHRLVASGVNIPIGMKNPTSGDLSIMLNAILAAQHGHCFAYRGWEVKTYGNEFVHGILRGYVNHEGKRMPNYHYEDLMALYKAYGAMALENPGIIIDVNHGNSNKQYLEQMRIAKEIMYNRTESQALQRLIKGFMIESYLEDGHQPVGGTIFGKSITDPCLGWNKTEKLIYELYTML